MWESLLAWIKASAAAVALGKMCAKFPSITKIGRMRKEAQAEVDVAKIKAQGDVDVKVIVAKGETEEAVIRAQKDLVAVGLGGMVEREKAYQENRQRVLGHAVKELPPGTNPENIEKIDKDKLAHLFRACETVSDSDMQLLWGKILAGEAEAPGSFSKKTMSIVSNMDKTDADMFTCFCQFAGHAGTLLKEIASYGEHVAQGLKVKGEARPFIYDSEDAIYNNGKYRVFDIAIRLTELISYETVGFGIKSNNDQMSLAFLYRDELVRFNAVMGVNNDRADTGHVIFTQAGKELFPICGAPKNEEFLPYLIKKWQEKRYNPQRIPRQ